MYDDDAIATLVHVRELVDDGWSPSEASRAVLAGEVTRASSPKPISGSSTASDQHRESLITGFVEAAVAMDVQRTGTILDQIFAQGSYESIVDDLIMPAAAALGDAWSTGRLDVAGEHAATAAIERRLAVLFESASALRPPTTVVGLPPGARHSLGALAFSVALRRLGTEVLYLGADVPLDSWVEAASRGTIRLAVIGIVTRDEKPAAMAIARAIRAGGTAPLVAVGGRYARGEAETDAGIVILPERINDAADMAARLARGVAVETPA